MADRYKRNKNRQLFISEKWLLRMLALFMFVCGVAFFALIDTKDVVDPTGVFAPIGGALITLILAEFVDT